MAAIAQDQSLQRWDALSDALREAMTSQTNSDFVWKTCVGEHLPEEKIYPVLKLVGYVLLGFTHPEDLAAELKSELDIDQNITDAIATAIGNRIFAPLKSELDKVYGPPPSLAAAMPKLMEEIKAPAAAVPPPEIAPTAAPSPLGEFERLSKVAATASAKSAGRAEPPAASEVLRYDSGQAEPLPVIIHEEKPAAEPLAVAPEFKISPPPPKVSSEIPSGKISAPPRPAVLEFGAATPPKPTFGAKPAQASSEVPRVVHYTDLKTPLEKPPFDTAQGKPQMERTEITAAPGPSSGRPAIPVPTPPKPIDSARAVADAMASGQNKPIKPAAPTPPPARPATTSAQTLSTSLPPPTVPFRPSPPAIQPRPAAQNMPPAQPAPKTAPGKEPMGEFEKLGLNKKSAT